MTEIPDNAWIDFRSWHAKTVRDQLIIFKEKQNGIPGRFLFDEVGEEIPEEEAEAAWNAELSELIDLFDDVVDLDDNMLSPEDEQRKVDAAMLKFADLYLSLWD